MIRYPQCRRHTAVFLWFPLLLTLLTVFSCRLAFAAPTLEELRDDPLPKTIQGGQIAELQLRYTDKSGDPIKASDALFIDNSASSAQPIKTAATEIIGDPATGATVIWRVKGLEQGKHTARFEIKALTANATYPNNGATPYEFVVEALGTKYAILGVGMLIGLVAVPFITYFLFRMMNPRGDPSRVARVGLLFGILAICALFIYLFLSVYGPLVYAILVLGFLGAIVLLFGGSPITGRTCVYGTLC